MTLTEATTFYTLWKDAYTALAGGKSYKINTGGASRELTRQDLASTKSEMLYWGNEVEKLTAGTSGMRKKFGTPLS